MRPDEAEKFIVENVLVRRQEVSLAKSFVIKNFKRESGQLIDSFLENMDIAMPDKVVLHESVDYMATLGQTARAISLKIAVGEAIWELIHNNIILPVPDQNGGGVGEIRPMTYTTVVPGGSGTTGGLVLNEITPVIVPKWLIRPPSTNNSVHQVLMDGDLYISDIGIENMDDEVVEALKEAIKCFRYDLYLASVAMLGKASEGAWQELGVSLVAALPESHKTIREKLGKALDRERLPTVMKNCIEAYNVEDFAVIRKTTGIKSAHLNNTFVWSNVVRESRNAIHFGAEVPMRNSYEKVATLLIGAVQHLKPLYRIKAEADVLRESTRTTEVSTD